MISIVTAYYNRKKIFIRTLESISESEYTDKYEVVVIDDGSREEERLEDQIIRFPFLKVIRLEPIGNGIITLVCLLILVLRKQKEIK